MVGHYVLHGVSLKIASESALLLGPVRSVLRSRPESLPDGAFTLRLRYGRSEPSRLLRAAEFKLFWEGTLPDGSLCAYYSTGGQRIAHLSGRGWGRLNLDERTMDVVCAPGQEGSLYDGCFVPLLCELLAHHGQFVVHAASLATEGPDGPLGVLLAGPSGAGKTTTALALARAGMILLTDDASFVESAGAVHLRGWRLPCKVHDRTARMLPWLRNCPGGPARTERERLVDVTNVVRAPDDVVAIPRLILLLGPRIGGPHRWEAVGKVEALAQLTRENVRAYEHRAAGRAFQTLGELVSQCDVYRLRVGTPLESLAEQILGLLR